MNDLELIAQWEKRAETYKVGDRVLHAEQGDDGEPLEILRIERGEYFTKHPANQDIMLLVVHARFRGIDEPQWLEGRWCRPIARLAEENPCIGLGEE